MNLNRTFAGSRSFADTAKSEFADTEQKEGSYSEANAEL